MISIETLGMNGYCIQLYSTIVLSMMCFSTGYRSLGWAPYIETTFKTGQFIIKMQYLDTLRIAISFIPIFFSVFLTEQLGRKGMKMACGVCNTVSWLIICCSNSALATLLGQIISKLVMGLDCIASIVYISEIPADDIRGTFLCLPLLQFFMGSFLSALTIAYLNIATVNWVLCGLSVFQLVLLAYLKETPAFLLRNGKEEEALESLRFYRGKETVTREVLAELYIIKLDLFKEENFFHESSEIINPFDLNFVVKHIKGHIGAWKTFESSEDIKRAAYAVTLHVCLISFMDAFAVKSYVAHYFSNIYPDVPYEVCLSVLYGSMMIGSGLGMVIIDLAPRRTLMIGCSICCTVVLALLAAVFRFRWTDPWLITVLITTFCIVFQMGVCNVVAVQLLEIFPSNVKTIVVMVAASCVACAHIITLFICRSYIETIGLDYGFFFFALMGLLNTLWAHYFMKETKNASIREIMQMYSTGYFYSDKHKTLPLTMVT